MGSKAVITLLEAGADLSRGLGAKITKSTNQSARTVALNLSDTAGKGGRAKEKLRTIFCPNAKKPIVEVGYDMVENGYRRVNMQFKDGDAPLSRFSLCNTEGGRTDFDVSLVSSRTQKTYMSAKGYSVKGKSKFSLDNLWAGRKEGHPFAHYEAPGIGFEVTAGENSIESIAKAIYNIFTN